jgi:hypothetical protein
VASEEFAPYYLAGIRHDIRQTTYDTAVVFPDSNKKLRNCIALW